MPPIVADGQLNLAGLTASDVYVVVIPPQTPLIPGLPTDVVGIVGAANKGPVDTPVLISDVAALVRTFGDIDIGPNDLGTEIVGALKQGAGNIYGVRVTDGADGAAFGRIMDFGGANIIDLFALTTGTWGNNIRVEVGTGSNNTATPHIGTITIGGTWLAADTVTAVVAGVVCTYVVTANETPSTVAAGLANKINTTPTAAVRVAATVNGAVITLVANTKGSASVMVGTLTTSRVSAAGTISTPTSPMVGGTGEQTWKLVITTGANEPPDVFDNIPGVFGNNQPSALQLTGAIDPIGSAAFNMINAINNGISGQRGPSSIIRAAIFVTPALNRMTNQTVIFQMGVNGGPVPTSRLLGVDGFTRTGMYALRGLGISQFGLAGVVDPTSWTTQIQFAVSENMVAVLAMASGTSSQLAVIFKQSTGVDEYHALIVKDFLYLNDTRNNRVRLVSPIGPTLGRIAALSPERSPGNKPILGYLGTERTGYVGPGGAFRFGIPYSLAEVGLLESNGILFMTQPAVGGGYLALRHGQNSSSDPTRNGINYSKMTLFLAKSLLAAFGFAVNEVHTPDLRRRVKSAISQFLTALADPGAGRQPMIGDVNGGPAYSVVCDKTNNPDNLVALGYMFVSVQVKYLSIVRFFVISLEAGQSVTIRVSASPISVQAA